MIFINFLFKLNNFLILILHQVEIIERTIQILDEMDVI